MLSADAHAVLAEQIERLNPSAAVLESKGVDWETAATLARFIKTGEADVMALKLHGLPLDQSVEICEAVTKRHARKAAALASVPILPAPAPAPPATVVQEAEMYPMKALSMLHTLFEQAECAASAAALRGRIPRIPCATTLTQDGWSVATAKELVTVINAARKAY